MAKKSKVDAFDSFMSSLKKDLGDGTVRVGFSGGVVKCEAISTRCLSLDAALGVGGVPYGRMVEIFGPESSGKTTLALHIVAEAQATTDKRAAFIDVEHAVDMLYAKNLGVNTDELVFSQPNSGEEAMTLVERMVDSDLFSVVVVDSVAALVPQCEIDGEIGDKHVAAQARLLSQSLRKLKSILSSKKCCVVFINQIRDVIGGYTMVKTTVTPGGRSLKFYSSIRMEIKRIGSEFEGSAQSKNRRPYANKTVVKVIKNKVAPPFAVADFLIFFGTGISREADVLKLGVNYKIIDKNGSHYSYNDNRLGNGLKDTVEFLRGQPEIVDEIASKLRPLILDFPVISNSEDIEEDEPESEE